MESGSRRIARDGDGPELDVQNDGIMSQRDAIEHTSL